MTAVDLICIDVDGTLIGASGLVTPEVWAALKQLRASGVRLAICSGRPAFGVTLEYAKRIDAHGWHIFQNGASVVCPTTMEARSTAIAPSIVERLIARMHATDRLMELYTDREYAVERDTDRAQRHASLLGLPYQPRPFLSLTDPIVRAQWLLPIAEREAVMAEPHQGLTLCPSLAPMMADTVFVNMTAEGVDKGSALRTVASAYDIPLARVMMIGDSHNDVPALRIAGIAVAMGNAQQAAIDAAHIRVGHVDEGGLLEALALVTRSGA
jgi:Cof subfamily protein (haloacid dehalogenase superfamily)